MNKRLLIIPGLGKAGTTFLYDQLSRTTEAFNLPKRKELRTLTRPKLNAECYFSDFTQHYVDRYYLDVSPGYAHKPAQVLKNIADLGAPEIKMILTLREPIRRILSRYMHSIKSIVSNRGPAMGIKHFSFFDPRAIGICMAPYAEFCSQFKASLKNDFLAMHMRELFEPNAHNRIGALLGVELNAFDPNAVSNRGGWFPHFIYGGREGRNYVQNDRVLRVPPNGLLLVNDERSRLWRDIDGDLAIQYCALGSTFTRELDVPIEYFRPAIDEYHRACEILGLEPEPISYGDRVVFRPEYAKVTSAALMDLLEDRGSVVEAVFYSEETNRRIGRRPPWKAKAAKKAVRHRKYASVIS